VLESDILERLAPRQRQVTASEEAIWLMPSRYVATLRPPSGVGSRSTQRGRCSCEAPPLHCPLSHDDFLSDALTLSRMLHGPDPRARLLGRTPVHRRHGSMARQRRLG
jgi:hypothetical protein